MNTTEETKYIYFKIFLGVVKDHSLDNIKRCLSHVSDEFGGIDALCSERWGIWDLEEWGNENTRHFEALSPTYDRQKAAFTELYNCVVDHRFKTPPIPIQGSAGPDIFLEEMGVFDHDPDFKKFGSPQKKLRYGIQDDVMYATAWCMYGGRMLSVEDFLPRNPKPFFGYYEPGYGNIGKY